MKVKPGTQLSHRRRGPGCRWRRRARSGRLPL